MNTSVTTAVCSTRNTVSHFTLALACATLATACSGEYPLGAASSTLDLAADADESSEVGGVADSSVSPVLPKHSFSISTEDVTAPGTLAPVGDLDGDGYADTAQTNWDFSTGASWVHVRYGGPRPRDTIEAFAFDRDGAHLAINPDDYALNTTVAAAGDVDGDGFDDFLLKSNECIVFDAQSTSGVYLVYGGPERFEGTLPLTSVSSHFQAPAYPETDIDEPLNCTSAGAAFGAGDLDGDGIDDIVITYGPQMFADNSVSYANGEGVQILYGRTERFPAEVPLGAGDALFAVEGYSLSARNVGDVTGDGRADLYLGPEFVIDIGKSAFLLEGGSERWSGNQDITAVATALPGVSLDGFDKLFGPKDYDGDGINDLFLTDADFKLHLFYGRSGLFADGFDFANSDAVVTLTERTGWVYSVGDLDGDGDDELIDQFFVSPELPRPTDIALLSGSRARLAGEIAFAEDEVIAATPEGRYAETNRVLTYAIPAGDLDGDGADDLFTISEYREVLSSDSYQTTSPQIHVHYGAKANVGESPR
jgi:hypothetical protein